MNVTGSNRRPRKLWPGLLAAVVLVSAFASPPLRADCLVGYADCVDAASEESTFWRRSAAGLRCYTEFLACLQRLLA